MIQDLNTYTSDLKSKIKRWGGDLVGVADVAPLRDLPVNPPDLLEPFSTAVSIAISLPWATFGEIKDKPTLIYENVYQTANRVLDELAFKTAKTFAEDGFYGLPIPASQVTDEKNWYGAISHKAVARMAGLGWQGKKSAPYYTAVRFRCSAGNNTHQCPFGGGWSCKKSMREMYALPGSLPCRSHKRCRNQRPFS